MGEEAVKMQEEPKVEEMKGERKEEKVEEPMSSSSSPFVLFVDLHCTGCAKKIEKSVMKIRGVEGVAIDMAKNEVTIKGIVEPQAVCARITKKTKRVAKILSPLPPAEGEPIPQVVNSQVGGLTVVELNVSMHCEACALQLKKKILKMRGVQTATTELCTGKVVVTGTMDGNKLVDYVYRRTKKQARIVPQPEPTPEPTQEIKEAEKPVEVEEIKKEEAPAPAPAPVPASAPEAGGGIEIKTTEEVVAGTETKKEEEANPGTTTVEGGNVVQVEVTEMKPSVVVEEVRPAEGGEVMDNNKMMMTTMMSSGMEDHESMKRMMYHYQYQPVYMIERIPPPQLFSDENPNACCIV